MTITAWCLIFIAIGALLIIGGILGAVWTDREVFFDTLYQKRAWRRYDAAVSNEEWFQGVGGLGHPEWITPPPFPDPRKRYEKRH
jgi:hypothetical protein